MQEFISPVNFPLIWKISWLDKAFRVFFHFTARFQSGRSFVLSSSSCKTFCSRSHIMSRAVVRVSDRTLSFPETLGVNSRYSSNKWLFFRCCKHRYDSHCLLQVFPWCLLPGIPLSLLCCTCFMFWLFYLFLHSFSLCICYFMAQYPRPRPYYAVDSLYTKIDGIAEKCSLIHTVFIFITELLTPISCTKMSCWMMLMFHMIYPLYLIVILDCVLFP